MNIFYEPFEKHASDGRDNVPIPQRWDHVSSLTCEFPKYTRTQF